MFFFLDAHTSEIMNHASLKKNILYNFFRTFSTIVFPLVTFPYISRVLLPESVGKINFGLSIINWFSFIASLGITVYAIRECSAVRNNYKQLTLVSSQLFSINIITTFIAYFLLAVTLIFFSKFENYRVLIVIQSLSIISATLGAEWLNIALDDFKYISIRSFFFQLLSIVLMLIFVKDKDDYFNYAIIYLISCAGTCLANIRYRSKFCVLKFTINVDWKKHIKPILFLSLLIFAQTIFYTVDSVMLGFFCGDYAVGIYSVAIKTSNLVVQLVISVLWAVLPSLSFFYREREKDKLIKLIRKIFAFHAILGIPLIVGTFMISNDVVLLIAGKEYIKSAEVLQILMIGALFTLFGISFLGNCILLPQKKEKQFTIVCCIASVINVFFNFLFIPQYDVIGAAYATSICSLSMLIMLFCITVKEKMLCGLIKILIIPVIGSIGIVFVCILLKDIEILAVRISCSIVCSAIVYFLINFFMKNYYIMELFNYSKSRF